MRFDLILANTNYDPERMTSYVRRFIERGVRGVAIMTSEFDRGRLAELARRERGYRACRLAVIVRPSCPSLVST